MERIGLLGGTFDPVHDGHIQLAQAAINEYRLDRVLLVLAAGPPHKMSAHVTDFFHRREMLKLALQGVSNIEPCFIEADLPLPSYTVDTLRTLQQERGSEVAFYFLIGMDAFVEILTWKSYRELLQRVTLIVARRIGYEQPAELDWLAGELGFVQGTDAWKSLNNSNDILFLETLPIDISSSAIRENLQSGRQHVPGVNEKVLRYIRQHNLYST